MKKVVLAIIAITVICIFLNFVDSFKTEKPTKTPGLHGSDSTPIYVIDYNGHSISSLFYTIGRAYTSYPTDIGFGTGSITSGYYGGQYSQVQEGGWIAWKDGILCYSPTCWSDKEAFYLCHYLSEYESTMTFEEALDYFK